MAICGAINKYGNLGSFAPYPCCTSTGFHLYILEILSEGSSKKDILEKENFWAKKIRPLPLRGSYNILDILNPFCGENHPRFGKTVPLEVRAKISASLKGRKASEQTKCCHMSKGSHKKVVYCYDFETGLICNFV